jgi:precorrin-2/cobalt-factor-2 C20-methyltransferase
MLGKLFGLGLGPGDPELVTVKAVRILKSVSAVAFPILEGKESFARSIAAQYIPEEIDQISIVVPMTQDRLPAQKAYDEAAYQISKVLDRGHDVACLCEGDPFFYGSFMYIFARLSKMYEVEIIPGVTSMTACAAVAKMPLLARNEHLTVIPGTLAPEELRNRILNADAVVIMKVGRHLDKIKKVLEEVELSSEAIYVEYASLPTQQVLKIINAPKTAPYFSMILVAKGADPWL